MTQPIGTPTRIKLDNLNPHHNNPRRGNVQAIADSLRVNGQFRPIVVNKGTHTGRPNEVLAGNHTLLAALHLDGTPDAIDALDCYVVDVDDDRATRIVLADNRTSDMGTYDDDVLAELLELVQDDLDGTGYDEDDLADVMAVLEEDEPAPVYSTSTPPREGEGGEAEPVSTLKRPDTAQTGLVNHYGQEDLAANYAERGTRMFVLAFPFNEYVWVSEQLDAYAEEHPDVDNTHPALVIDLLARANNTTPPEKKEEE